MKKLVLTLLMLTFTQALFAQNPTVILRSAALGYSYTQPFKISVTFNEPITGFGKKEINIVNGTISNVVGIANTNYTMTITPLVPGAITLFVPAGLVKSIISGATNLASNKLTIMALNPIVNPSSNIDLSLWTLILPLPLGDVGGAETISNNTLNGNPVLNSGYTNAPYFFTDNVTGAMDLFAPLYGATTPNSIFPRSELSEYLPNFPHTWTLNTFVSNSLTGSLWIVQMPPSRKIVIAKIQDKGNPDVSGQSVASKPLVKIYYDSNPLDPNGDYCGGCLYIRIRPIPAQEIYLKTTTLARNIFLNELFQYKISLLNDGTLKVTINDKSISYNLNTSTDNTVGWGTQELFFKAGVYIMDNGASKTEGAEADYFSLQIKHTPKPI